MGKIIIQNETTKNPLELMGKEAGICWGANINDTEKNKKRGIECLKSGHGRVAEYVQVYMILDEYSAKVVREFYTAIGGAPTRLQASTRYIDYAKNGMKYVIPKTLKEGTNEYIRYCQTMKTITEAAMYLEEQGIPKEDASMLLPLGMTTKVVVRTNLRNLIDMSHQRLCTRAFWEYRDLMNDMCKELFNYSEEWEYLIKEYFKPKCEVYGYCTENKSCGRKSRKE